MENNFGKTSTLNISSLYKDKEAILDNVYFTAPFKVMQPFRVNSNTLKVMILSASAGIMEGDIHEIDILIRQNTNIGFISQAYEKIHRMQGGHAKRNIKIKVEKKSRLRYMPLPTIPFKDSAFISNMSIELEDHTSQLILSEILSAGRVFSGEEFQYLYYHNLVEVKRAGKVIYRDNSRYEPNKFDMKTMGMYEGYSHFANMLLCNCNISDECFYKIREYLYENTKITGDITRTSYDDIVVRILGDGGEILTKICEEVYNISILYSC